MKGFLPNALICFAIALCGLCAFQWVREARLRAEIAGLYERIIFHSENNKKLEGLLNTANADIARLDGLKTELTETLKTNRQEIAHLKKELAKDETELERELKQVDAYKNAMEIANANIKQQNADIRRQNEQVKQLVGERNETVLKYNKIVEQYNDLVKQFTKYQEDVAKANATNRQDKPAGDRPQK